MDAVKDMDKTETKNTPDLKYRLFVKNTIPSVLTATGLIKDGHTLNEAGVTSIFNLTWCLPELKTKSNSANSLYKKLSQPAREFFDTLKTNIFKSTLSSGPLKDCSVNSFFALNIDYVVEACIIIFGGNNGIQLTTELPCPEGDDCPMDMPCREKSGANVRSVTRGLLTRRMRLDVNDANLALEADAIDPETINNVFKDFFRAHYMDIEQTIDAVDLWYDNDSTPARLLLDYQIEKLDWCFGGFFMNDERTSKLRLTEHGREFETRYGPVEYPLSIPQVADVLRIIAKCYKLCENYEETDLRCMNYYLSSSAEPELLRWNLGLPKDEILLNKRVKHLRDRLNTGSDIKKLLFLTEYYDRKDDLRNQLSHSHSPGSQLKQPDLKALRTCDALHGLLESILGDDRHLNTRLSVALDCGPFFSFDNNFDNSQPDRTFWNPPSSAMAGIAGTSGLFQFSSPSKRQSDFRKSMMEVWTKTGYCRHAMKPKPDLFIGNLLPETGSCSINWRLCGNEVIDLTSADDKADSQTSKLFLGSSQTLG